MPSYTFEPGEELIATYNRHWIDLVPSVFSAGLLVIGSAALTYLYGRYRDSISIFPAGVVLDLALVILLLGVAIFFLGLYVYRQNRLVLTNQHLIQVEQRGIFGRTVSQLSLSRVQDVSAQRNGFMQTILNFGSIEVETAGEQENFVFRNAANPSMLADRCLQLHERYAPTAPSGT